MRQALAALLRSARQKAGEADPLFADGEVWSGDAPIDLARNHDRYLYGDEY